MRKCKIYRFSIFNLNFARAFLAVTVSTFYLVFRFDGNDDVGSFSISLLSLTNPHLNCVLSNSVESVQSLLSYLVAVVCPAEVSLFCFDRSVVTLLRASVTPPSPPSDILLSFFSLYPRFASYCECRISSTHPITL